MKRYALIAAVVAACIWTSSSTGAQERCDCERSARSSVLGEARYEVVMIPRYDQTYRLDRFTGEVSHLQRSGSRFTSMTLAWKALPLPPGEKAPASGRANYQLTLSEGANFPLLMNVHTGATWTLRTAAGDVKWEAIALEKP
jgi:hypothetical protein